MAASGRDSAADAIIRQALQEEEAQKKLRKSLKLKDAQSQKAARKGMSLEEIEAHEGGPIKESLTGMAQTKRAARRKGRAPSADADTDLVDDLERAEEELEVEEEGGVKLEAFNLKEERRRGYFDAAGNYVEREGKEEEEGRDAWLDSVEAKVVDEQTRRRIQERECRAAAAEAEAVQPSAAQLARLQWQVAQLLEDGGETVAQALKRLGGHSRRPATKARRGGSAADPARRAADPARRAADPAAKERFDALTEAVTTLMEAGDPDVYSRDRTYFERAAAVYIDVGVDGRGRAEPSYLLAAGPSKAAYEEADEDMFAEEREEGAAREESGGGGGGGGNGGEGVRRGEGGGAAAEPAGKRQKTEDVTDYGSWPVKELRRFLAERGQDPSGIVEKADLVGKVKAAAASGSGSDAQAPAGYAFDPQTGMWLSAEAGMYWDAASGGFYNSADGKWYSYCQEGQWEEWAAP